MSVIINRNIAYFISSNSPKQPGFKKAMLHLRRMTNKYGLTFSTKSLGIFGIHVVHQGKFVVQESPDVLAFRVGQIGGNPMENDRYLNITIEDTRISIINDYAGSIPVYYSLRGHLSLSNIEPCTVLDSGTSVDDLSPENIWGFLRYMHFIWDETAFRHIFQMLPDSNCLFNGENLTVETRYLETVQTSDFRVHFSDRQVAEDLFELNKRLVHRSLIQFDSIILPLSSGYDSRMIFAALAQDDELKKRLHCFTYGSEGSIEVEAGKRLTSDRQIHWKHIELPCNFLEARYLHAIYDIFGSSLHMHGMYQIEFLDEVLKNWIPEGNYCLTSGFMTGVPAGQHNGLLHISSATARLTDVMDRFSQSRYWIDADLCRMPIFDGNNYHRTAEERLRMAFDRFNGPIYQKTVIFDVWTRQRNFIGYYPRTLEWICPVVSPHMCAEYQNFFFSLSEKHLYNRAAVELMFRFHYMKESSVASNSNGMKSLSNRKENCIFSLSHILSKFHADHILPRKYWNEAFFFDVPAIKKSSVNGVFPIFSGNKNVDDFLGMLGGKGIFESILLKAVSGDETSYQQLVGVQAIAFSLYSLDSGEMIDG